MVEAAGGGLPAALEALDAFWPHVVALTTTPAAAGELRQALRDSSVRRETLYLLLFVDPSVTRDLAAELVDAAQSDSDADLARSVLARLAREDLLDTVAPEAGRAAAAGDVYDLQRIIELLWHLGLTHALAAVLQQARDSGDPERAEVAQDNAWMLDGAPGRAQDG